MTWAGNVGIPGGIPKSRTQFADATQSPYFADKTGATDASSAINAAINACPANQFVFLPAGTYKIGSGLVFGIGKSSVTLRGAGNTTILKNVQSGGQCIHFGGSGWPIGTSNPVSWTGGLTQGSTVLTVSSTTNFTVGGLIWLTQNDDVSLVWSDQGVGTGVNGHVKELKRVTAIAGNTITIDTPIIWTQWSASFKPIISTDTSPTFVCSGCGLESVQIDGSSSTSSPAVFMEESYGCWLLNVYSNMAYGYNVVMYNDARCEFRRTTLWDAQIHAQNCGGFVLQQTCTSCLFEDNIMYRQCPSVECDAGCSGNAFLYNFSDQAVWTQGSTIQEYAFDANHDTHGMMNLYEGNYGQNVINDGYHGSGSHFTFFRNRLTGYSEDGDVNNSRCVDLCRWSLYNSVVGNVLGVTGFSNVLDEKKNNYDGSADHFIYRFGFPNLGNGGFTGYRPMLTYAQDQSQQMQGLDEAVRGTAEWNENGVVSSPNLNGSVKGTTIIEGNYDAVQSRVTWNDPTIGGQHHRGQCSGRRQSDSGRLPLPLRNRSSVDPTLQLATKKSANVIDICAFAFTHPRVLERFSLRDFRRQAAAKPKWMCSLRPKPIH
jgi:hypothetical protein